MTVCANFETFKKKAEKAGLQAKECSIWHWQVIGGKFLVNYFPHGKRGPLVYVAGTNSGVPGSDELAIKYASQFPTGQLDSSKRRCGGYKKHKIRLFKKDPRCYWCKKPVTMETASLEHIIPLSQGGLNNPNNYSLAHKECNNNRGNKV